MSYDLTIAGISQSCIQSASLTHSRASGDNVTIGLEDPAELQAAFIGITDEELATLQDKSTPITAYITEPAEDEEEDPTVTYLGLFYITDCSYTEHYDGTYSAQITAFDKLCKISTETYNPPYSRSSAQTVIDDVLTDAGITTSLSTQKQLHGFLTADTHTKKQALEFALEVGEWTSCCLDGEGKLIATDLFDTGTIVSKNNQYLLETKIFADGAVFSGVMTGSNGVGPVRKGLAPYVIFENPYANSSTANAILSEVSSFAHTPIEAHWFTEDIPDVTKLVGMAYEFSIANGTKYSIPSSVTINFTGNGFEYTFQGFGYTDDVPTWEKIKGTTGQEAETAADPEEIREAVEEVIISDPSAIMSAVEEATGLTITERSFSFDSSQSGDTLEVILNYDNGTVQRESYWKMDSPKTMESNFIFQFATPRSELTGFSNSFLFKNPDSSLYDYTGGTDDSNEEARIAIGGYGVSAWYMNASRYVLNGQFGDHTSADWNFSGYFSAPRRASGYPTENEYKKATSGPWFCLDREYHSPMGDHTGYRFPVYPRSLTETPDYIQSAGNKYYDPTMSKIYFDSGYTRVTYCDDTTPEYDWESQHINCYSIEINSLGIVIKNSTVDYNFTWEKISSLLNLV